MFDYNNWDAARKREQDAKDEMYLRKADAKAAENWERAIHRGGTDFIYYLIGMAVFWLVVIILLSH